MAYRRAVASSALLGAALIATVGPKLAVEERAAQLDLGRLNADVERRLRHSGFKTTIDAIDPEPAVFAVRGSCSLLVRNGDRARELNHLFTIQAAGLGPVEIHYRGDWHRGSTPGRAIIERSLQDSVERIGLHVGRPAVLAAAWRGGCEGLGAILAGITAHASLR
ncbi:hypothetical protein [Flavisphingomonas formosensis]|uniref:hypothetical protein n=1 Tax=Flavisphingomonas formosensis TaxID=861534 RepID=UPI0012F8A90E|nr:hypothetical protein [Sphingomonas formosensis]